MADRDTEHPSGARPDKPVVASREILGDSRSAIILHEGETYILRVTRQGKLVLNK